MVNHAWTLLLGLPGQGYATGAGEEYTPPTYQPPTLPTYLQTLRNVLFGPTPDRRGLLYRTRQYMAIIHASPLAEFVTALDPRISYMPFDLTQLAMPAGLTVMPLHGNAFPLILTGPPPVGDVGGRLTFSWAAQVGQIQQQQQMRQRRPLFASGSGVLPGFFPVLMLLLLDQNSPISFSSGITITEPAPGTQFVAVQPTFTDHLSEPVTAPAGQFTVQYYDETPPGSQWIIEALAEPAIDVGAVFVNLQNAGFDNLQQLFGEAPVEPYRTWQNLFQSNRPLPWKLGAAVMAVIQRTHELLIGG